MTQVKLTNESVRTLPAGPKGDAIYPDADSKQGVPGLYLRVRKTGARTYVIQWRQGSGQRRSTVGKVGVLTLDDARKKARKLLVGIDDYRYVQKLQGATSDAKDIAASLRLDGARDVRVILDDAATRGSLLVEFQNLVARTNAGDTVFVTLSGHGAQEPERVKGSEPNGKDEVFLLAGFDPAS